MAKCFRARLILAFSLLTLVTTNVWARQATSAAPAIVDFQADILPILQLHCFKCHDSVESQGGLRLDRKQYVIKGGHTGAPVLSESLEESELYQRLVSDDPNYRMPKDQPPLAERDVAKFASWLTAGSPWPESEVLIKQAPARAEPWNPGAIFDPFDKYIGHFRILGYPLLAFLILMLLIQRAKKRLRKRTHPAVQRPGWFGALASRVRMIHYVVVMLLFVVAGLWLFHRGTVNEITSEKRAVELELLELTAPAVNPVEHGTADSGPVPRRLKHPRSLHQTYYRGNNERSPQLFNGGYYRTATLRVSLCDANKKQLEYGDEISNPNLYLRFEIERAKHATAQLFRESIMQSTYLSKQVIGKEAVSLEPDAQSLTVVEAGERWVADYPITLSLNNGRGQASGMVYVYNGSYIGGNQDSDVSSGLSSFYHYGITYDVVLENGKITQPSEVWMGSLFQLKNLYFPPPPKPTFISADEWFDFRDIPEIEGENSQDPELLGTKDYEGK